MGEQHIVIKEHQGEKTRQHKCEDKQQHQEKKLPDTILQKGL